MASKACCELAPVAAEYDPKGRYETIAGFKTYVTGPEDAGKSIVDIYDVFGYATQSLQGADRLAAQSGALVVMPDLMHGDFAQESWFPVDTEEKKAKLGVFLGGPGDVAKGLEKLLVFRKGLTEKWPKVEGHVGVFGLCWGGKVAILACGKENEGLGRKFVASGTAHPGRLEAADAEVTNVPHICLASPGEPAEEVAKLKEVLAGPGKEGVVETYPTMFHGWMGARANLKDEANVKEFERGYKQTADFFAKYL